MKFRGEFNFLSNFYPSPIVYKGKTYPTAEHLFQAAKTESESEREWVRTASTPKQAKYRGRKVTLRSDWNGIRVKTMRGVLKLKFDQHPELMRRLKAIKSPIVEDNTWGDTFWGKVNGRGHNFLGRLLENIRDS